MINETENKICTTEISSRTNIEQHECEYTFVVSEKSTNGILNIIPDFLLEKMKTYQIYCQLTPVVVINGHKIASHVIVTTACINCEFIGGKNGYKIDIISSDQLMDEYFDDTSISMSIKNNKICIDIKANKECDIFVFSTFKITVFFGYVSN